MENAVLTCGQQISCWNEKPVNTMGFLLITRVAYVEFKLFSI